MSGRYGTKAGLCRWMTKPLFEELEKITITICSARYLTGICGEGGIVRCVRCVDVKAKCCDIFDIYTFGATAYSWGVLDAIPAKAVAVVIRMLFVVVQLPGSEHHLLVKTSFTRITIGGVVGTAIGACVTHGILVLIFNRPGVCC